MSCTDTEKTHTDVSENRDLVSLDVEQPIWDRFFTVAPIVIVGTRENDGFNFAPKHLALPLGWRNRFGFVCTPKHHTYQNAVREGWFTVSFPRPSQVVITSLTAGPRCDNDAKPVLNTLRTFCSTKIDGAYIDDGYLYLGCKIERLIDGFDESSLIVGTIVEAFVRPRALRQSEVDDRSIVEQEPLLAYTHPGHYTRIKCIQAFPFSRGFSR